MTNAFNPDTDLQIERVIRARPETIWRCWQDPDLFRQWFCPKPVQVTDSHIELIPGGRFFTEMTLPDGTVMPNEGLFLHVETNRRIISTDALRPGYRPAPAPFMTVDIQLTPTEAGTRYHAHIMHAAPEGRQTHLDMGFDGGWGTMLEQLDTLAGSLDA